MEGYRWFLILGVGLLQICLAPVLYIPWLPSNKVIVPESMSWLLWVALTFVFLLSLAPLDRSGYSWVRFVSACFQGTISGYCLVLDTSTMFAQSCFAVSLGVANAFDRLGTIKQIQQVADNANKIHVEVGATGRIEYKNEYHEIVVEKVNGSKLTLRYKNFFLFNTEVVDGKSSRLKLDNGIILDNALVFDLVTPGYRLRPWGFALGMCASQWIQHGFGIGDAFVSGILTGQALIIVSPPITMAILCYIADAYPQNSDLRCMICLLAVALVGLGIVCLLPLIIGTTTFAVAEMLTHQIVIFVAIPVDIALFWFMVKPTADDIAQYGLVTMLFNADSLIASTRLHQGRAGRTALLANAA